VVTCIDRGATSMSSTRAHNVVYGYLAMKFSSPDGILGVVVTIDRLDHYLLRTVHLGLLLDS
jgi:hypothetical protein